MNATDAEPRNWSEEHAAGAWDFLASPAEQNRLALIAALARGYARGTVIDFGCGAGLLARWLDPDYFSLYVGVDVTATAFERSNVPRVRTRWIQASIDCFAPDCPSPGSALVFSEVLYYLDRPVDHLVRLVAEYRPGCVILSNAVPDERYAKYVEPIGTLWENVSQLGWRQFASLTLSDAIVSQSWRIAALGPVNASNP